MSRNSFPDPGQVMMSQVVAPPMKLMPGQYVMTPPSARPIDPDPKSLILVLHKINELGVSDRRLLTERRLFCSVTLGASHVRTSMATETNPETGEVTLGFIIRLPLPNKGEDHPLLISLIDSATNNTVASGRLDSTQIMARSGITVNNLNLHPEGVLRYHVRLNQQPTGSASVQRMTAPVERASIGPRTPFFPPPPSYSRVPYPHTMASIPQVVSGRYSDRSPASSESDLNHFRASTMTAASLNIGGTRMTDGDTWRPMEPAYRYQSTQHSRSASEGLRPRRLFTRPTRMSNSPTTTYLKTEDGRLQMIPGLRCSPLGQSVMERLGAQTPPSAPQRVFRRQRSGPMEALPHLVGAPETDQAHDITRLLQDLMQAQERLFAGETPRAYTLKVVHPFKSVSIRIENLDEVLGEDGLCSLGFTSTDGTVTKDVVCINRRPDAVDSNQAEHPTVLLPVNLNRKNVVLHIVVTGKHVDDVSRLEIPLQGLLRTGKTEVSGFAMMTGSKKFVFSLKLLALPFSGPVLMRPQASKFSVNVMSPSESAGFDSRPASTLDLKNCRSDSVSEEGSVITTGAPPPQWNHLCVTVTGIDDSSDPIPDMIGEESTKDLYCKVSLGTTTALRAKFVGWRQTTKKLPDFEFEHKGERVLKISLVGTAPGSKLNLGVCRIDLNALSRTGRSYFRGKVPLTGSEELPNPPHLNLTFRFSVAPAATGLPHSATSWRQVLQGCNQLRFIVNKLESDDLSVLRQSFCIRLSCGKFRFKTPRLEVDKDDKFQGPVKLVCDVNEELLDALEMKPLVVCIYVKLASGQPTNSHAAYQFCRLSPNSFVVPSEIPRTVTTSQELNLAPDVDPKEARCTMHYSLIAASD